MANNVTKAKTFAAGVAVACLMLVVPVQMKIDSLRSQLTQENVMPTQLPLSAAALAALGGFRGLAVDILWIQSDNMINEKQFYQLKTYYKIIATLQPNFTSVWTYNAWNLSYNIAAEWGQPDEKWLWIKEGIEFASEGLIYNPDSEDLNIWVGWLYFNKVGKDPYFAAKLDEESGVDAFLESYKYFSKAYELALARGTTDVRYGNMCMLALVEHADAVLDRSGNVAEAMEFYDRAEAGTELLAIQFPDDAGVMTLLSRIKQTKASFGR